MPRVPTMNNGDSPPCPRPLTATLRGRRPLVAAAIVVVFVLAAASTAAAGDKRHVRLWLDTGVRFAPASVVQSSAKSGFAVDLPAGRYVVEPRSTGATTSDRATPFSMRIARGAWRFVPVMFDTGIR